MSTAVHHASMYANQSQDHGGDGVLADTVTPVIGGPAVFNGLAPSNKAELDQYNEAGDFSTNSVAAWASNSWVDIGKGRYYRWDGSEWVQVTVGTGISTSLVEGEELVFTGGRAPTSLDALNSSDFGQTTAWDVGGQFVRLGGVGTDGPIFHWDGAGWVSGPVPSDPVAVLTATPVTGAAPLEVVLDASGSSDPDDDIATYTWDLDEGDAPEEGPPILEHTFETDGTYEVEVTVTDSGGRTDTDTVTITVT